MSYVDAPLRGVLFSKQTIFYSKPERDFTLLPYKERQTDKQTDRETIV